MFQQNLQPHKDQNNPAGKFCFGFKFFPEHRTDLDANAGQQKGCQADHRNGNPKINLQKSKRHADGASIDVATERRSIFRTSKEESTFSSSFETASRAIFSPISVKRTNAIQ